MGAIVIALLVVGLVAIGIFANRIVEDLGFNPDGTVDQCELIESGELQAILGGEAEALPMGSFVDATVGQMLDKRLIGDAPDCWLISDTESSITGRLARVDSGGGPLFLSAAQEAHDGGFYASEAVYGDEAFCTSMTDFGGFGILVRRGDRVAYVSLLDADAMQNQDFEMNDEGQLVSPETCDLAGRIAEATLR